MTTTQTISPTRPSFSTSSTNAMSTVLTASAVRYALHLPLPVPSSTRATTSLFSFRLKASRILKVVLGTVLGFLGVTAAWWALDLTMWTAVKEWRDDCREQQEHAGRSSDECSEILTQELAPPPTWRSFLQKFHTSGSLETRSHRSEGGPFYAYSGKVEVTTVHDDDEGFESFAEHDELDDFDWTSTASTDTKYLARAMLASRTVQKPDYERALDAMIEAVDCEAFCGAEGGGCSCSPAFREGVDDGGLVTDGIRQHGDGAIMYGGDEQGLDFSLNSNCQWGFSVDNDLGMVWANHTSASAWDSCRVNPITKPAWWDDDKMYDSGPTSLYDWPPYLSPLKEEELDWSRLAEQLRWRYGEKISISRVATGSFEGVSVHVNTPRSDVWKSGYGCDEGVTHVELGAVGWNVFDAPEWIVWERIWWWGLGLMLLVLYETVGGGRRRRRGEAAGVDGRGEKEKVH